ncbi:MAG: hypothetical protein RRA92_03850 [Gemmatimonadota bacterium]|nr:hypothetical protein [Gemmatimonadota bacterium]
MIGRPEIREIVGMLGTLAALSLAGRAVQVIAGAGLPAEAEAEVPAVVEETPDAALEPDEAVPAAQAVGLQGLVVAPPDVAPHAVPPEIRLERPEVMPPPLRCPPLPAPTLEERLPGCRSFLA